jgi:predicted metal-binding membrane protein
MSGAALETLLRRDRVVVGTALTVLLVAARLYLLHRASAMSDMAIPDMPTMPGMAMPAIHAWSWADLGALVIMWAVMMVAMMTPAAAPMILMFATIHRRRTAEGRRRLTAHRHPRNPPTEASLVRGREQNVVCRCWGYLPSCPYRTSQ